MSRSALALLSLGLAAAALHGSVEPPMSGAAALRALRGLAGAVAWGIAAAGFGRVALRAAGRRAGASEEPPFAAALILGLALAGTVMMPLAALGRCSLWTCAAVALAGAAGWSIDRSGRQATTRASPDRWGVALLVLGLGLLAPGLLDALAPPVDTDEIYYHLALPAEVLRTGVLGGGLWFPDASRPVPLQLSWAGAMALGGEPAPKLLHWGLTGLLLLSIYQIGARRIGPVAGGSAALLGLGSYSLLRESGLAYNNLPAALAALWAFEAALAGRGARMALLAGTALALKYTAAGPVTGIFLLYWLGPRGPDGASAPGTARRALARIPEMAALSALALVWVAPWWIRNAAEGLHPLFPYAGWPELTGFTFMYPEKYGAGRGWVELLTLPWGLTTAGTPNSYLFLGRVSPAGLALLAPAIWAALRGRSPAALPALIAWLAWAAGPHSARYLLPGGPLIALALATGLRELPAWGRLGVAAVWLAGLPANLGPHLAEVGPRVAAARGAEPPEALLEREIPGWAAVNWVNQHAPEDARIALLFAWPRYHLERPWLLGSVEDHVPPRYLLATRGEDALQALRGAGATHALVGTNPFLRKPYRFLSDADWRAQYEDFEDQAAALLLREGTLVFESSSYGVWRLEPRGGE